jgi:hypothetical protein
VAAEKPEVDFEGELAVVIGRECKACVTLTPEPVCATTMMAILGPLNMQFYRGQSPALWACVGPGAYGHLVHMVSPA